MCGFRSCIARMLFTCFTVRGNRRERTVIRGGRIGRRHGAPGVWWKYSSTAPRTLTMGLNTFWKKSAIALSIRSHSSYRVESSLRERVATEHPEDAHENALRYAVLLYGLQRVKGAARRISARRGKH